MTKYIPIIPTYIPIIFSKCFISILPTRVQLKGGTEPEVLAMAAHPGLQSTLRLG